jgi:hypothetical protein
MPDFGKDLYSLCEVMLHVDSPEDLEEIYRNLPIIETEIRLGVESSYYARRILDVKGLSPDEKTAMVQECITYLVRRLPKDFDFDVMMEMQHVLVMCRDDFKAARDSRHLSRIISIHYLFRKRLREAVKQVPEKRHLHFKLFKTRIKDSKGEKHVLAIVVGINFLLDNEAFEKRHLMTAIQNYLPNAHAVEDSFFANRRGTENIATLYLEIEKAGGAEFSSEEIQILRNELPIDLKDRIEHLMHPIFMPRNEEEIMRNVLSLSSQIKYIRDIPQVAITFDEQSHTNVFFTVILVRVAKPGVGTIQDYFKGANTFLTYIPDRCKTVGYLRKKYAKEATIFRVKLTKSPFLRRDHSIDLYKARQAVFNELCRLIGDMRDFNGGMISKQNELLCSVRELLGEAVKYNELLLENFFYSLLPVSMRTVLEPEPLKTLFLLLLEMIESGFFDGEKHSLKIKNDPEFVYVIVKSQDLSLQDEINRVFAKLQIPSFDLASSYVIVYDTPHLGYIYRCDDPFDQKLFCHALHNVVQAWESRKLVLGHIVN